MVVFQTKGFKNTERSTCQSEWVNLFVSCAQGSTESVTDGEEGRKRVEIDGATTSR